MSRIGNQVLEIPDDVTVTIDGSHVKIEGPKGEIERDFHPAMTIIQEEDKLRVERPTDRRDHRSLHGLTGSLLSNMIQGVIEGFEKKLEIVGVGYRAESAGGNLRLQLGFSHPVEFEPPEGVTVSAESPTVIRISGVDKEKVGQTAAEIRSLRPPEPYKGKGIRYAGEHVRRKAGKAGI